MIRERRCPADRAQRELPQRDSRGRDPTDPQPKPTRLVIGQVKLVELSPSAAHGSERPPQGSIQGQLQIVVRRSVRRFPVERDAIELTIGGRVVMKRTSPKAGGFAEPESIPVKWNAGWNPVIVKIIAPGAVNKLTVKAVGEGLRTAAEAEK